MISRFFIQKSQSWIMHQQLALLQQLKLLLPLARPCQLLAFEI